MTLFKWIDIGYMDVYLQCTISMTLFETVGGIPLLAMHKWAPILSLSTREIENDDPLMLTAA